MLHAPATRSQCLLLTLVGVTTTLATFSMGCRGGDIKTLSEQIADRRDRVPLAINDGKRADEVTATLTRLQNLVDRLEQRRGEAQYAMEALHRDPQATREDAEQVMDALRRDEDRLLQQMMDLRMEAASQTTPQEWNRINR